MKQLSAVIVFFFCCAVCFSQSKKPEFEFTLYGEDSRGHKDSVIIGFDHNARTDIFLDTVYGDKNIAYAKYDSIFEMRAHKVPRLPPANISSNQILFSYGASKHITLNYSDGFGSVSCVPTGRSKLGFILIKIKYPPLKLSWNNNQFGKASVNYCVGLSYLLFNEILLTEYPPEQIGQTVYMHKNTFLIDSLNDFTYYRFPVKFSDGTIDTLQSNYVFDFVDSGLGSPTENIIQEISKVYPNPCSDILNLFLPEVKSGLIQIKIYGINGVLIQSSKKSSSDFISVETASLAVGNYLIEVLTDDNRRFIAKFSKM